MRGSLFENTIILEFMRGRLNRGLRPALFFCCGARASELGAVSYSGSQRLKDKDTEVFNSLIHDGSGGRPVPVRSAAKRAAALLSLIGLWRAAGS